jgi:glycosyltransferase involved in cell wall biosynthesis
MKITIISPFFPYPKRGKYYGQERYTENLAIHLKNLGNHVKIVTNFWNGGKRYDDYKGIKILRVKDSGPLLKMYGTLDYLHYTIFGLSILKKKNFRFYNDSDILLLNIPLIFSRFFTIKKIPTISIFHHFIIEKSLFYKIVLYLLRKFQFGLIPLSIYHYLERSMFRINKNVITISERSKKDLIKYYDINQNNIEVIPNGVDLKKFNPRNYSEDIRKKYGQKILFFSGLMVKRKNIDILLKAMVLVLEELPEAQLILTGKGPLLENYKSTSKSLNIENNVHFLGFVPDKDLIKYYATSDIYVFPSNLEGFGQVVIEALASGTPVICSNLPPMSDIIENAGLTFMHNSPSDLANKIIELLKNKVYETLQNNTLRVAKKYKWSNIAKIYYKFIKEIAL